MGFLGDAFKGIGGDIAGALVSGGMSMLGNAQSNASAQNLNLLSYKQAKEFAQNQIQWKVRDARKAGIHPLAALGVANMSAPVASAIGDSSGLSEMGQNLSRAIDSWQNRQERAQEQAKADKLQAMEMQMKLEQHRQSIAESNSRIAENQAKANVLLNPVKQAQSINYVSGAPVRAQPRVPARPRVLSGRQKLNPAESMGQNIHLASDPRGKNDLMAWQIGPNGEKVLVPSPMTAETGQNLWGLLEAYGYGSYAVKRLKDWATKAGKHARRSGYFERALNQW